MAEKMLSLEVAYALPDKQALIAFSVIEGSSVEQAIEASGVLQQFPEIDLVKLKVGIWNRTCRLTDLPKTGDRIEIYRPLIADPKQVRRLRAERAKAEGRAEKVTGGRVKPN